MTIDEDTVRRPADGVMSWRSPRSEPWHSSVPTDVALDALRPRHVPTPSQSYLDHHPSSAKKDSVLRHFSSSAMAGPSTGSPPREAMTRMAVKRARQSEGLGRRPSAGSTQADNRAMPVRRYASSPLALHSTMPRMTDYEQPHHLQSPSSRLGHGRFGHPTMEWSTSPPPPTHPTWGSPTNLLRTPPPLHAHAFRSPNGSIASAFSRRRLSEQSLGNFGPSTPHVGSLVGSYEESLLTGRMSSLPSKPLYFDAELGVLGMGRCKASLRCPPHVNFKFPAYFYKLEGASEREGKVSPTTPYVGTVDLESHYVDQLFMPDMDAMDINDDEAGSGEFTATSAKIQAQPMRPTSPQGRLRRRDSRSARGTVARPQFPGYRVPAKGQVQLVIKNPNCTAVKVFLVPYDLTDMPAGTKTFVRQKCHVAPPNTPVVEQMETFAHPDAPPASLPRLGSPSQITSRPAPRETLRYAVHLQFCAVASSHHSNGKQGNAGFEGTRRFRRDEGVRSAEVDDGADSVEGSTAKKGSKEPRIYLHKAIRVVFSARVPDRTEKLTTSTEMPRDGHGVGMFSNYTGPGEEWLQARRMTRDRHMATSRYEEQAELDQQPDDSFTHGLVNSDPNGEKWQFGTSEGMGTNTPMEIDASISRPVAIGATSSVDLPIASMHRQRDTEIRLRSTSDTHPRESSAATMAGVGRTRAPTLISDAVLHAQGSRSASPALIERGTEDRALLDSWHASLAVRSHPGLIQAGARPASPSTSRARPISPTSSTRMSSSMHPAAPATGLLSAVMRHKTSQDSMPSTAELTTAPVLPLLLSSSSRSSLRGPISRSSTPQRTGSVHAPSMAGLNIVDATSSPSLTAVGSLGVAGIPSPKLSEASLDMEPANGTMLPLSTWTDADEASKGDRSAAYRPSSITAKSNPSPALRPTLMRRLSSQAGQTAIASSASSQASINAPASLASSGRPITTVSSVFGWRQLAHVSTDDDDTHDEGA